MRKDINFPKVEGIKLAIAKTIDGQQEEWFVYLINQNDINLQNVLITSKGYGQKDGETQKTSTLRHMIELLPAHEFVKIEKIQPEVFHLSNEFWLSYYVEKDIYDKKFVFTPDNLKTENLKEIPWLNGIEGFITG